MAGTGIQDIKDFHDVIRLLEEHPEYLVVEVSWTVDPEDVERATRRAIRLAKTGLTTLLVVAGEAVGSMAAELAHTLKVWPVTNTEVILPAS
jgi:hypothetical protein